MQPDYFAYPAAYPISLDRGAQSLFDAPAEAADVLTIGTKKYGEFAARTSPPFPVHRIVLFAMDQSAGARKSKPRRIRRV
jgi:hypothetical protein